MKNFSIIFLFLLSLIAAFWFGNVFNKEDLIYESAGPGETKTEENDDSNILISEVFFGDKFIPPFVELYNTGYDVKDLSGFSIKKSSVGGNESTFVSSKRFNNILINPRGYLLMSGASSAIKADIYWPKSYSLPKNNSVLSLYDSYGEKIDEVSWSSPPQKSSLVRISWKENYFSPTGDPTPQNSSGLINLVTSTQGSK